MIKDWCEVLPAQSICLRVPVIPPHAYHEPMAERQREGARRIGKTTPAEPSLAT
jgi:beta-glucosidase